MGNIMIDTLERERDKAERIDLADLVRRNLLDRDPDRPDPLPKVFQPRDFAVVTLHRPSNVDHAEVLGGIVEELTRAESV